MNGPTFDLFDGGDKIRKLYGLEILFFIDHKQCQSCFYWAASDMMPLPMFFALELVWHCLIRPAMNTVSKNGAGGSILWKL